MLTLPHNKVGCEPLYDPDTTASGRLYIPDVAQERCDQGIVKYVGDKVTLVKPGDHVLFSGYTGTLVEIQFEGRLIIMPESYIIAIIHDDTIIVPGAYFRSREGEYIPATWEQLTNLAARALEKVNRVGRSMTKRKIDFRPAVEEYVEAEES